MSLSHALAWLVQLEAGEPFEDTMRSLMVVGLHELERAPFTKSEAFHRVTKVIERLRVRGVSERRERCG